MSSNVKGLEGALNQEKALLEGAFFMIVKTDGSFAALVQTDLCPHFGRVQMFRPNEKISSFNLGWNMSEEKINYADDKWHTWCDVMPRIHR